MNNICRTLLFIVFFAIGVAALGGSILCDDLVRYYCYKQLLKSAEKSIEQLESLNREYDALLTNLQNDPNLIDRIVPATLGTEPADANAVYPRAAAEQLEAASKALADDSNRAVAKPAVPEWLRRYAEPRRRIALFFTGAALVLIAFVCFTPVKKKTN